MRIRSMEAFIPGGKFDQIIFPSRSTISVPHRVTPQAPREVSF